MIGIFVQTLPFFALVACGYLAIRSGIFAPEASAYISRFVFYFALPAMLFRFSATLPVAELLNPTLLLAYFGATMAVYLLVLGMALLRGTGLAVAAIEAQCGAIGNVGFLAIPMLTLLMGEAAIAPAMMVLSVDQILFGALIVILINAARQGRVNAGAIRNVLVGVLRNPLVMSMAAGLIWSVLSLPVPVPAINFLTLLGSAATPCALFAIGASMASITAGNIKPALWLAFSKLVLHPAAVAVVVLMVLDVDPFAAGVMIAAAAMPTAGNAYILAQHFNVAPYRAASTILLSTVASVVTLTVVIGWVTG